MTPTPTAEKKQDFQLTSSAFDPYQKIPVKYTCDGANTNPPLTILGVPDGTKAFALTMEDPDAPNGTFSHWLIWNIPGDVKEIPSGDSLAGATQGTTSAGKPGYYGPCPPSGIHRYFFTLYALDAQIGLGSGAKKSDLDTVLVGHILGETRLVGVYSR
ncbi:hypothetical protein A2Z00_04895 [Candidatus Gottesmanbacteria bacterium RBG_13_45_10]|uniref:Kinase inhibitor n=1 Tax=Candidatus Gottesmanbacteria bacterium RBG_13_45_10 TaxID=1798370 RepID=A0A1F5ZGI1_9BACT|nr:MAG: hypothetical protein A2Z00_04895 [Candidatus Gottesmanbacteria bacterium RBG_13_45_10]